MDSLKPVLCSVPSHRAVVGLHRCRLHTSLAEGKKDTTQIAFQSYISVCVLTSRRPCYIWQWDLVVLWCAPGYTVTQPNRASGNEIYSRKWKVLRIFCPQWRCGRARVEPNYRINPNIKQLAIISDEKIRENFVQDDSKPDNNLESSCITGQNWICYLVLSVVSRNKWKFMLLRNIDSRLKYNFHASSEISLKLPIRTRNLHIYLIILKIIFVRSRK
jgi:hypothetical protein